MPAVNTNSEIGTYNIAENDANRGRCQPVKFFAKVGIASDGGY